MAHGHSRDGHSWQCHGDAIGFRGIAMGFHGTDCHDLPWQMSWHWRENVLCSVPWEVSRACHGTDAIAMLCGPPKPKLTRTRPTTLRPWQCVLVAGHGACRGPCHGTTKAMAWMP